MGRHILNIYNIIYYILTQKPYKSAKEYVKVKMSAPELKLQVKRLSNYGYFPTRATSGSAGYDLYSSVNVDIAPGEMISVPLQICLVIPDNHVGQIHPRSSLVLKQGLVTEAGIIDSDYRGELIVLLRNISKETRHINRKDRIAQILILPVAYPQVEKNMELPATARNCGGFGSTGR